jgi:hypothetical protein
MTFCQALVSEKLPSKLTSSSFLETVIEPGACAPAVPKGRVPKLLE